MSSEEPVSARIALLSPSGRPSITWPESVDVNGSQRTIYGGPLRGWLMPVDGRFLALRADDGRKLWEAHAGSGVIAAPVTYAIDGVQYVSVVAGWGGVFAMTALAGRARCVRIEQPDGSLAWPTRVAMHVRHPTLG